MNMENIQDAVGSGTLTGVIVDVTFPETEFGGVLVTLPPPSPWEIFSNIKVEVTTPETNFGGVLISPTTPQHPLEEVGDINVEVVYPETEFGGVVVEMPAEIPIQIAFPDTPGAGEGSGSGEGSGLPGPVGPQGEPGLRGSLWFTGPTNPGTIPEALPNDLYLNTTTGDIFKFV